MKQLTSITLGAVLMLTSVHSALAAAVDVKVNVNAKHTVGGISSFDRSKFVTIHASHNESDWDENSINYVMNGNDVYFGRDTGYITWYRNNTMSQDSSRPGWVDEASVAAQGSSARGGYNNLTWQRTYESRATKAVTCAQWHPFWPDGTLGNGWAFSTANTASEPFGSATGHFMGHFLNEFYGHAGNGYVGPPLPPYVEVINEPDWELHGWNPPASPTVNLWSLHNSVAHQIKSVNNSVLVGGSCTAFPDFENNNFDEWNKEWKSFIDTCGTSMDFYSLHFYDFNEAAPIIRRGSNMEAAMDLVEQYSDMTLGEPRPFVISEFGGRNRGLESGTWSSARDWDTLKSFSSMMMSYMDRPHLIDKVIPFIMLKAEWHMSYSANPYPWRLFRKTGEPSSYTGDWTYTEMIKLYQLWSDVNGTRVDVVASDPDVQVDAYVDGDKVYVILNNLNSSAHSVSFDLDGASGNSVQSVVEKSMYLSGSTVAMTETTHNGNLTSVTLPAEGTTILEYDFANNVTVNETSDEVKYYASTYLKTITAGVANTFQINGVNTGNYGDATLRLGMGRSANLSKQPTVLVNGTQVDVTTDFMGHEGDSRATFFGVLDITVPYNLLQANNTISVTFPDSGGHISSVTLRAYKFSTDLRGSTDPVNQAPSFSSSTISKSAATEGVAYSGSIAGNASDPEGDTITFSKTSGPAWLSVASNGSISGTPAAGDVGANSWSVQVSDNNGGVDTATLNVTVNDDGNPDDDVNLTIEAENFDVNGGVQTYTHSTGDGINWVEANDYVEYNVSVPQTGTYTIDYYISTPLDGSTISFLLNGTTVVTDSVPNNGSWDTFTSATRSSSTVALTAGANTIRLVAGSNAWQWNLDKVVLTTSGGNTPVNQAPEFSSSTINKSAATENASYSATISGSATDADGDSLTYSKASGPSWLSVASNGSLSGTPGSGDVGNNSWTVQVSDGSLTDTATLNITVNADVPNNQAPAFGSSTISKANATENSSYSATISGSATDSDGDSLTYSKVSGPAWLSVASNGSLSGTPASSDVGANSWTVQVSDGSLTDTATLNITVDAEIVTGQTPYGGSARSLASQIEAEDFDEGGEDVAYNDTGTGNSGNSYRTSENVDIQGTSDTGAGYNVGWMADGEWLEYTVNATAGTYDINLRVASVNSGRQLRVVLDGVTLATLDVPNTGGWQAWQTVTAEDIVISGGNNKILRIEVIGNGQNLNWIEFDAVSTDPDPDPDPASFTIEAENMDVNGGVQTYTTGGIGAINWVQANDYVEYNVTAPQTGTYNIDYYISTPLDGGTITFQLNGTDVVTDSVPNNGSWDVFTSATRSSSTVNLTAGANTIRLTAGTNAWQWNLDKVVLSTP